MEKQAQAYFDLASHATGPVTVGNGGEFVVPTKEAWQSIPGVICTVRDTPDMLTATASRQRLELTGNSLPMAVDAAESIGAKNSLERMLAHELAAAHRLSGEVQGASVDGLGLERQVSRLCRAAVKAVQDMRGGDHAQARIVVLQSVGQRLDRWRR
ncbi:hypothetical protein SAMN02990966_06120 [Rhodospirillales bacterium URHD0017]|nr:hypothetical protein SAMN02990966_06120 [Rhodospirillales bacterium URHD0017]